MFSLKCAITEKKKKNFLNVQRTFRNNVFFLLNGNVSKRFLEYILLSGLMSEFVWIMPIEITFFAIYLVRILVSTNMESP